MDNVVAGLFNMLSDASHEMRQQADAALSDFLQQIKDSPDSVDYDRMAEILISSAASADTFTRLTSITWINELVKFVGDKLQPYYADILGVVLYCISDKEERIQMVAQEINEVLKSINPEFDIDAILVVARRALMDENETTRLEAKRWINYLQEKDTR